MPLSDVQFSRFAEMEVAKVLTFLSRGLLECMLPMTDDERRDIETHLKEHFRLSLAIQVKAAHVLYGHLRVPRFQKSFMVKAERLIADPFFFYFFGYMDLKTMAFRTPVFFVPSEVVHRDAVHRRKGDLLYYNLVASMDPRSHDRWRAYACDPAELADRIVRFLREQARATRITQGANLASVLADPGTLFVTRAA